MALYDYIIIGGGTAGSHSQADLHTEDASTTVRQCVIEAGDEVTNTQDFMVPGAFACQFICVRK